MRKFYLYLFLCMLPAATLAMPAPVKNDVENAQIVGKGKLSIAFWSVYDATLYAPDGTWSADKPHALSITYHREIDGPDIADRSAKEMRKQGTSSEVKIAAWHTQMRQIFPDVQDGTTLTATTAPGKPTHFYKDGIKIGSVLDPEFGQRFFDIWLSKKTSEPELRTKLLSQK